MENKPIPAFSYHFLTPFYDFAVNLLGFGTKQRHKIVNLLEIKSGENLLDVGCGTGSLLLVAKKIYPNNEMVGIDVDSEVLEIASKKFKKNSLDVKLINTSTAKLPFNDSSFDTVVSTLIFHHLPTKIKLQALQEIHRVLKKDGRFLLVDFGRLGMWLKLIYWLEVIFRVPEAKTAKDNVEGKIPYFLKEAGFKFQEASKRYRGVDYILARKES